MGSNPSFDSNKFDQYLTLMVPAIFFMMTIILNIIVNTPGVSETYELLFIILNITYSSIMILMAVSIRSKQGDSIDPSKEEEKLKSFLSYFIIMATALLPGYVVTVNYHMRNSSNRDFQIMLDYNWEFRFLLVSLFIIGVVISQLLWTNIANGLTPKNTYRFWIAIFLVLQVFAFFVITLFL